ncbi:MAG: beta-lactamase family protein, partial [Flavobacteriaceae bacterium]|nr:beta-lactamase family protein [Flavobacteriaceae bacterium]
MRPVHLFLFLFLSVSLGFSQDLETQLDNYLAETYSPEKPGATVLISRDGKAVYRKAFGMADLELGVKMKPEHVFEIGSITKQFTAVSIL